MTNFVASVMFTLSGSLINDTAQPTPLEDRIQIQGVCGLEDEWIFCPGNGLFWWKIRCRPEKTFSETFSKRVKPG
jgi:hypothetical protein